jgi:hypothetical protein
LRSDQAPSNRVTRGDIKVHTTSAAADDDADLQSTPIIIKDDNNPPERIALFTVCVGSKYEADLHRVHDSIMTHLNTEDMASDAMHASDGAGVGVDIEDATTDNRTVDWYILSDEAGAESVDSLRRKIEASRQDVKVKRSGSWRVLSHKHARLLFFVAF